MGIGIDTTKGTILSIFEFDPSLPRSSSQTFERNVPDLPQEGSCSEVKPTCGEDGDDGSSTTPDAMIGISDNTMMKTATNDDTALVIAGIKIEIVGIGGILITHASIEHVFKDPW
jgi:hypothetical protein